MSMYIKVRANCLKLTKLLVNFNVNYHKYTAIFVGKMSESFCIFTTKNNSVFDNVVGIYLYNELTS